MASTVNLGFENKLWEMADKLRGNIESSEFNPFLFPWLCYFMFLA